MAKMSENTVKNRNKRKKFLFLALFAFISLGLLCGLSLTVFFPVKNVVVEGDSVYTAEEIIKASGISEDDNLILLNENSILLTLQQSLPFIKEIELKKVYPNKVLLKVKDVDTYLLFKRNETTVCTDDNMRIIPNEIKNKRYELVIYCNWQKDAESKSIVLNNEQDGEFIKKVIVSSKESGIIVNVINMEDEHDIRMLVDNRFEVIFGDSYDFDGKFSKLNTMVMKIDKEKTGRIDLSDWTPDSTNTYFVEADVSKLD